MTIQAGIAAAASTLTIPSGIGCGFKLDPNLSTQWIADCGPITGSGGTVGTGTLGTPYINNNGTSGNTTSPQEIDTTVVTGSDACARAQTAVNTNLGGTGVLTNDVDSRGEIGDGIPCITPPAFGVFGTSSAGGRWRLPMGQLTINHPLFVFGKTTYEGECISYDIAHCSGFVSNGASGTGGLSGCGTGTNCANQAHAGGTTYFVGSTVTSGGFTWYSKYRKIKISCSA